MPKLNAWLSTLLKDRGADLFRSKGILSIAGSDDRWAPHANNLMRACGSGVPHHAGLGWAGPGSGVLGPAVFRGEGVGPLAGCREHSHNKRLRLGDSADA
jgi:hypothetical protein